MIFNENGKIINEGIVDVIKKIDRFDYNLKRKFKKKKPTKSNKSIPFDKLKSIIDNYNQIHKIIKSSFNENVKIVAKEYDSLCELKTSFTKAFSFIEKDGYIDDIETSYELNEDYEYEDDVYISFFDLDVFQLKQPKECDEEFFNAGIKMCELINDKIQKSHQNIKINFIEGGDWDDYSYGCKLKDLMK